MDPEVIGAMIFTLLIVMLIAGVIMFYPLVQRLGNLIEARAREPKGLSGDAEERLALILDRLHGLEDQVRTLSERQDFTEKLLSQPAATALPPGQRDR